MTMTKQKEFNMEPIVNLMDESIEKLNELKEREKEYPLFPELTEQGKEQAQNLMIRFEKELKESALKIMENITTDFYCDVLNEIEGDHWTNYRNNLLNGLSNYNNYKKATHDFDRIRKAIYANHKELIVKDLNQDLLEEIEGLKLSLKNAYR